MERPALRAGDHIVLRKPHPCGSAEWVVTRLGADVGLMCVGCGRRVMRERDELERRIVRVFTPETHSAEEGP